MHEHFDITSMICALLTKREVKMAGYWPSYFLHFYGPRRSLAHKNAKKNEANIYPATLTEQAWSIKDLFYGQKITPKSFCFCGTNAVNPDRAR